VTASRIPFLRLTPGEDADAVRAAIDRVIASGRYVLGPEVEAFEADFARAAGMPSASAREPTRSR
jgi:dTDP-4-amino-4,6-dideoxygalactose transaminase